MAASLAVVLAGCASDGELITGTVGFAPLAAAVTEFPGGAASSDYDDNASYAGRSVYRCDNGETLNVENSVEQVAISGPDGSVMQLPASPADSHTRYAKDQYALVFDGDEALYFRPKASPATCKR